MNEKQNFKRNSCNILVIYIYTYLYTRSCLVLGEFESKFWVGVMKSEVHISRSWQSTTALIVLQLS